MVMAWCDKIAYGGSSSFMGLVVKNPAEFSYVHGSAWHPSTGDTFERFRKLFKK